MTYKYGIDPIVEQFSGTAVHEYIAIVDGRLYRNGPRSGTPYTTGTGQGATATTLGGFAGWQEIPLEAGVKVIKAESNGYHAMALLENGNLYAWGYNAYGQLGLGHTTQTDFPTLSATGVSNFWICPYGLYADYGFSYHLTTTGVLKSCGYNEGGALGIGTLVSASTWTACTGLTGVTIKNVWLLGPHHGFVVVNGTNYGVYVTGFNLNGALGNSSTANLSTFTNVSTPWNPASSYIKHVGGAAYYAGGSPTSYNCNTMAILFESGVLKTCGFNTHGQCGNATTTNVVTPYTVAGTWVNMAFHTLTAYAINSAGQLYGWGYNGQNQLGDGTTTQRTTPTLMSAGVSRILNPVDQSYWYNYYTTLAVEMANLSLKMYGDNGGFGKYGDGTTATGGTGGIPKGINNVKHFATMVGSNNTKTYVAITKDNTIYMWGDNTSGASGLAGGYLTVPVGVGNVRNKV